VLNHFNLTEHFNLREFQCKCGCGTVKISSRLVSMLEALRQELGVPFVITSGYRCPTHNANVGGAKNSYHVQGLACDIACPTGYTVEQFTQICLRHGFTGVGAYPGQNFVHVDVRPGAQIRFQ
jgi:uncharacterized protein YcbK (DUF882 family)